MKKNYLALPVMLAIFTVSLLYPAGFSLKEGLEEKVCLANNFMIDQSGSNSVGEIKRYIDLSSPWSGAYLYEDMHVVGSAEIIESFTMYNIRPGAGVRTNTRADDFFNGFFNSEADVNHDPGPAVESNPAPRVKSSSTSDVTEKVEAVDVILFPTWLDLF